MKKNIKELLYDYLCLNECDLSKFSDEKRMTLSRLYDYPKKYKILLQNIEGLEIFIQNHAYEKMSNRFPHGKYNNIRRLITNTINGSNHIKEIILEIFNRYKSDKNKKYNTLGNELSNIIIQKYNNKDDKSYWNDDLDDIKIKFSLYTIFKISFTEYYVLEGAVAIALSLLIYKNQPLMWLKNNDIEKWNDFLNFNNDYKILDNINMNLLTPVINITGYTTWVKRVTNLNTLQYLPTPNKLNQKINSINVYNCLYEYCYPYFNNIINISMFSNNYNSKLIQELEQFESMRDKSGQEFK